MIKQLRKFTRITSSDKFIPEIDGLRFLAIVWVVLFHLNGFVINKTNILKNETMNILNWVLSNGEQGVELFFVISGFVVALPFIKYSVGNTKFSIKAYYIRRFWRLIPPCLIITVLLYIMHVFVVKKYAVGELSENLLTSSFYISTLVFNDRLPLINPVTWSLEIEMQFYLIAPFFLKYVFSKQNFSSRLTIYSMVYVVAFLSKELLHLPFISLLDYTHYFIIGILLCDIYKNNMITRFITDKNALFYLLTSLLLILLVKIKLHPLLDFLYPFLIFIFYYSVLNYRNILSNILRYDAFVIIGGMCYSIYLIHYFIISFFGNQLVKILNFNDYFKNIISITIIILPIILLLSVFFYRLIERPFMKLPNRLLKYVE